MPDTLTEDGWKERYRELLAELEGKERAWQSVESTLRNAASRLGIAAMGRDATLDAQLQHIVHAVREPGSEAALGEALDAMSKVVIEHETTADTPVVVELSDFVAQLPLPVARQKHYQSELASRAPDAQRAILQALAADIAQVLSSPPGDAPALVGAARQLLARLSSAADGSSSLARSIAPLKQALAESANPPDSVLNDIADAVAAALVELETQKTELEKFLEQVTERLGEFEAFAGHTRAEADARREDTDALDSGLTSDMHALRDVVDGSQDLDALKRRVASRLDTIASKMQRFREREAERAAAAEARSAALTEQINRLRVRTAELAARCGDQEQRLMHDALTGVHTRYAYDQRLQEEFQRWQRHGQPLIFSIWDIDHFKRINDTFGHEAGDRLLAAVAGVLSEGTRTEDFVARLGGEEFVIVFVGTSLNAAHALAERLRVAIAEASFTYNEQSVAVTISCGLTAFRKGDTPEDVYRRADGALYQAKQAGRNRSVKT